MSETSKPVESAILTKLTDTNQYTGTHAQRFDAERLHLRDRVRARLGAEQVLRALEVTGLAMRGERRRRCQR